jgi:hypothetical protein
MLTIGLAGCPGTLDPNAFPNQGAGGSNGTGNTPGTAGAGNTSGVAGTPGGTAGAGNTSGAAGMTGGAAGAGSPTGGCDVTPLFIGPSSTYKCSETAICHNATGAGANFKMAVADWQNHLVNVTPAGGGFVPSICAMDPMYKNMPYIKKGDPNGDGLLLQKLQGDICMPGGVKMPLSGNPVSPTDLDCVKKWAKALAAMP